MLQIPLPMDLSEMPFLPKGESDSSNNLDDEEFLKGSEALSLHQSKQREKRYLSATTRVITILLALWGFISMSVQIFHIIRPPLPTRDVYRPETLEPTLNLCDCGSSIDEALSKNCIYDSLATAWLPPHCRDDELTAEFDLSGPGPNGTWPYFADANGTIPIDKSQIAALGDGERSFWSLRDWHIAHCMFYWEKYVRMRDTGVVMERRFDRVAHTRHCRRLVMNPSRFHQSLVEVPVMMNSRIVESEEGHKGHKN